MFIVQSGPIKNSLVAFSTRTLAEDEDEEEEDEGIILSLPLKLCLCFSQKQEKKKLRKRINKSFVLCRQIDYGYSPQREIIKEDFFSGTRQFPEKIQKAVFPEKKFLFFLLFLLSLFFFLLAEISFSFSLLGIIDFQSFLCAFTVCYVQAAKLQSSLQFT